MKFIAVKTPPGTKPSDFDPFPGSAKAVKLGCICPLQRSIPDEIVFAADCPVHELEKVQH